MTWHEIVLKDLERGRITWEEVAVAAMDQ